jgi:hypothetical protein
MQAARDVGRYGLTQLDVDGKPVTVLSVLEAQLIGVVCPASRHEHLVERELERLSRDGPAQHLPARGFRPAMWRVGVPVPCTRN